MALGGTWVLDFGKLLRYNGTFSFSFFGNPVSIPPFGNSTMIFPLDNHYLLVSCGWK